MAAQHWLVKQEPSTYAWSAFEKEGRTAWTGVRNFQARNHLRAMKTGDLVAYYHSGESREVVGLARVAREAYPDPTATEGDWSCVDLVALQPVEKPVTLSQFKADPILREAAVARFSRLSVTPLTPEQFARMMELAETRLPKAAR